MGISKTKLIAISLCALGVTRLQAEDNRILKRLEHGEVISSRTGSSFFVQALTAQTPDKVRAVFSDLTKLPTVFPQVAFAVPYVGKGKDEGRNFLYLKLRGLGDGVGVLMEVKSGGGDAFANAKELILGGEYHAARSTEGEVDITKEANQVSLKSAVDEANARGEDPRFVDLTKSLVLEGPLNEVMEMPNVRFTIHFGVASYTSVSTGSSTGDEGARLARGVNIASPAAAKNSMDKKSYLIAKVSVGNQIAREGLGDIRGFGDARLALAESLGSKVLSVLRTNLEK